ncbi:MAG: SpoIIE family protein phosphatase [Oscillospiraceae bacterium]|nr:SpoIIE family protein phosphatase [Oscillospiraceae bacterium]
MTQRKKRKNRVASLQVKTVATIIIAALILSFIVITISYRVYSSTMDTHYKTLTSNLAKTAASQLSAEDLLRYYDAVKRVGVYDDDQYWSDEEYRAEYDAKADAIKDDRYYELLDTLFEIKDSNEITYLYVQKLEGDQCTYIMDADRSEEQCQLGTTHNVSGPTKEAEHPEYGIPAFITNDTYGWLCTSMEPVWDDAGKPVALVGVDVSMDDIMQDRANYLRSIILIMGIAVAALIAVIHFGIARVLIKPINMLSDAARSFVQDRSSEQKDDSAISRLNIRTGDEVETLCDSVKQMEQDINSYIENLSKVTAEKERIGAELNIAAQIQADMLPRIFPAFPERSEFDLYATMDPAKEVGGDFYDYFLIDDDHIGLVMADVSGKGVPAALFMVIAKTLIKNRALTGESPAEILKYVNEQLCEGNDAELFVTVWLAIIEISTGKGMAANAGHEHPAIRRADGSYELVLYRHSPAVATMEGLRFREHPFELHPGDSLFVYTDGVPEATNAQNELFGTDRMLAALNRHPDASPKEQLLALRPEIDAFVGSAPQFDDITMMSFRYLGPEKAGKELTVEAADAHLAEVLAFVDGELESLDCPMKTQMQVDVAVEEIFVNIAHYAYAPGSGQATIRVETSLEPKAVTVTFTDKGIPYDPLSRPDPDVTLSAEERQIGGLGIYMVKKTMNEMEYEYRDGQNVLRMKKYIE